MTLYEAVIGTKSDSYIGITEAWVQHKFSLVMT